MHLNRASIYDIKKATFLYLLEYCQGVLLTLEEDFTAVISTYYDDASVRSVKVNVNIEYMIFSNAWDTDRSPCLSVLHWRIGEYVVQDHSYVS